MSATKELEEQAAKLQPQDQEFEAHKQRVDKVRDYISKDDSFKVAKFWYTTPVSRLSNVGMESRLDLMAVLHTDRSERNLANIFHDNLENLATSKIVNKSVLVNVDGVRFNVTPTKFAQQGSIGKEQEGPVLFREILGKSEMLSQASLLVQQWQHNTGLDFETQRLTPSEIEMLLAHIMDNEETDNLQQLMEEFFRYGYETKFSTQLNIFDQHGNILLNHDFRIPDKQVFLESLIETYDKIKQDEPDFSQFYFRHK